MVATCESLRFFLPLVVRMTAGLELPASRENPQAHQAAAQIVPATSPCADAQMPAPLHAENCGRATALLPQPKCAYALPEPRSAPARHKAYRRQQDAQSKTCARVSDACALSRCVRAPA